MAGTPDAPVLTATAAGRTSIALSWTVPNDNGMPIVGYQVQRWDNASARMEPAADGRMAIAAHSKNNTETP